MADTIRTEADLTNNIFPDNQAAGSITAQDMRDFVVSIPTLAHAAVPTADFTPGAAPTWLEGRVFYDSVHKALSYYNDDSEVTINIGQEMVMRAQNISGVAITDGDVVYISGAGTEIVQITKAIASTATPEILGVATSDIPNNEYGYVTIYGLVHGLDTSAYSPGDIIYLSSSVAGAFTNVAPTLPIETLIVGTVINATTAPDGHILVSPRRVNYSNQTTVIGNFYSFVTQDAIAEGINTIVPVEFELENIKENVTHSNAPAATSGELTIEVDGVYKVDVGIQTLSTSGTASQVAVWMQEDTGGGWVNTTSATNRTISGSGVYGYSNLVHTERYVAGNKIRPVWSTTNTNGTLASKAAAGVVPAIPSVVMTIQKIGTI